MYKSLNFINKYFKHIPKKIITSSLIKASSRSFSALYIPKDKATENCVILVPFMDFEQTLSKNDILQYSIINRKLNINLQQLHKKYEEYKNICLEIDKVKIERENVTKELNRLNHTETIVAQIEKIKEKGKSLRNYLKKLKESFNIIENEFIQDFLNLPNILHSQCPIGEHSRVIYRFSEPLENCKNHLDLKNFVDFVDNHRYYLLGKAAEFDLQCSQSMALYFRNRGGFMQTSNPDFVKRVLLEANTTPQDFYYKVLEENMKDKINISYLLGGASFESFLGCLTKFSIFPSLLPLKWVSCGRFYKNSSNKTETTADEQNLYTAIQTNAVQIFSASASANEAEEQMQLILNLCADFYKCFDIHFRIIYLTSSELTPAESLRAQIEIYSPYQKRYICIGSISNYSDYVSKRILFVTRKHKDYNFPHLVGGPILFSTRLIAALLEHEKSLVDTDKLLKHFLESSTSSKSQSKTLNEFKSLFQ